MMTSPFRRLRTLCTLSVPLLVASLLAGAPIADAVGIIRGAPPSCAPSPAGLALWFPAESDATDSIGGIHANLVDGVTFGPGTVGQAFSLDGIDSYVETDPTAIMNSLPLSLEAWVKPTLRIDGESGDTNEFEAGFYPPNVLSNDRPAFYGFGFGFNVSTLGPSFVVAYHNGHRTVPNVAVAGDVWYHVVVVYQPGRYRAYVNGSLVDEFTFPDLAPDAVNTVRIGKHNDDPRYGTRRFFQGLIDEASLYEAALSADEVRALFDAGSAGKCPQRLAAELSFDPPGDGDLAAPRNLTVQVLPVSSGVPGRTGTANVRMRDGSVTEYRVYRSGMPNVQPTPGNFYTSLPPSQTTATAPLASSGTFFVVTAVYGSGESGASNEAGAGQPGATIRKLKVKPTRINATGSDFTDTVKVFIDGIPFATEAVVKSGGTKVVQKGALVTGQSVGTYKPAGTSIEVTFLNSDGRITRKTGVIP